jgi:hypothetical protein
MYGLHYQSTTLNDTITSPSNGWLTGECPILYKNEFSQQYSPSPGIPDNDGSVAFHAQTGASFSASPSLNPNTSATDKFGSDDGTVVMRWRMRLSDRVSETVVSFMPYVYDIFAKDASRSPARLSDEATRLNSSSKPETKCGSYLTNSVIKLLSSAGGRVAPMYSACADGCAMRNAEVDSGEPVIQCHPRHVPLATLYSMFPKSLVRTSRSYGHFDSGDVNDVDINCWNAQMPPAAAAAAPPVSRDFIKFHWKVDPFELAMADIANEYVCDCIADVWLAVGTDAGTAQTSEFVCPGVLLITTHRFIFVAFDISNFSEALPSESESSAGRCGADKLRVGGSCNGTPISVECPIYQVSFQQICSMSTHCNWKEAGNIALEVTTTLDLLNVAFVFRHRQTRAASSHLGGSSCGRGMRIRRHPSRLFNHIKEEVMYRKGADEFDLRINTFESHCLPPLPNILHYLNPRAQQSSADLASCMQARGFEEISLEDEGYHSVSPTNKCGHGQVENRSTISVLEKSELEIEEFDIRADYQR